MKSKNSMKKIDFFKLAYDSIQPGSEIWYSGGENNEITTKEITQQLKRIQLEELRKEANKFIDKEDTDLEFTILSCNGSTCEIWISCPNKPNQNLPLNLLKYLIKNGTDENKTLPKSLIITDAHFRNK